MASTLERLSSRLPAWARGWHRRRVLAVAAVVVLVVVLAVSCGGGAGGRTDVPVLADGADAGLAGVRSPSDRTGGTLRVVAPTIDSLDPQRSYLPGVWNLMRLYTRTLVTYSSEPGRDRPARPRPGDRPGHPVGGRPELDLHPARGRALRDRPADHLARRQVRDRALLRLRRRRRRPDLRRGPARRPGQSLRRPVPGRGPRPPRTGRRRDPGRPHHHLPAAGAAVGPALRHGAARRAARCPSRTTAAPVTGATPCPPGPTPSRPSTPRRASCWSATRVGPGHRRRAHRPARPRRRADRADRPRAGPGGARRLGRRRPLRHGRAAGHHLPARDRGRQPRCSSASTP